MISPFTLPLGVGLHYGIPAAVYHADPAPSPSLSSGCARTILAKSLAHARHEHARFGGVGKCRTKAMDCGLIVHSLMAGTDGEIELGDFDTLRSAGAKKWASEVRSRGGIPALERDMEKAHPIAEALRAKCWSGLTRNPLESGRHEVTAIWEHNGTYSRARYDVLDFNGGPFDAWDWKVTTDCSPAAIRHKISRFGYHRQAAHYLRGLDVLFPAFAGHHSFIMVFVEDAAPWKVQRVCLHAGSLMSARRKIEEATALWEHAIKTDRWPDGGGETLHLEIHEYDDDLDDEITIDAAA